MMATKTRALEARYSRARPTEVGWYWFTAGEKTDRKAFPWGVHHLVLVGCDENENVYGVIRGQARFTVKEMHGFFAQVERPRGWLSRPPQIAGHYWFEPSQDSPSNLVGSGEPFIVEVKQTAGGGLHVAAPNGKLFAVSAMGGTFAGPLVPPAVNF